MSGAPLRRDGDGVTLACRVQPRAGRDEFGGLRDGRVLIRLAAPPVDGKANDALRRFLAAAFAVPPSAVTIEAGLRGRLKRVHVRGATRLPEALVALGLG